ncbi:MAG: hypothetical protein N4A44_02415 [Alphaproteobacteria bacterium]|jgi:hypothetical protein|nr:hypothetical protein [Alphaproteobacteria bacterium]
MRRRSTFGRNLNKSDDLKKYIGVAIAALFLFLLVWKPTNQQTSVETKIDIPTPKVYK